MHAAVCDYISDIVQNSVEAGAAEVRVNLDTGWENIKVSVRDNGKGMSPETLAKAEDPFYTEPGKHSARKVGLGLPFLQELADQTGGKMEIATAPGKGTTVSFSIPARNWDTPPMGDIPGCVVGFMCLSGKSDITFRHARGGKSYEISKKDLVGALGDLERADSIAMAKKFLKSQETELLGGSKGE